jgi:3-hydroxybutyryl-CoA dehydrogenase
MDSGEVVMKQVAVVGTGLMGTDIAFASILAGFEVVVYDADGARAATARERIADRLRRYEQSGRLVGATAEKASGRIVQGKTIEDVSGAMIVIECVSEDREVKQEVFHSLDATCRPDAVLCSNTSSISITEIASATKRPESVIGLHFLNPAHVMKLVEIIPGIATTRETVEVAKTFVKKLGKTHVESKDYPGFMLNRMLVPMINEAIYLLYESAGTAESIDRVIRTGLNFPMGPLALADLIGLDVLLAVIEEMFRGYSDSKYRPCPLLKKYVAAGYLGKKSGRGFYIYND